MRILHTVESYYPSLGGMQTVVKELSERLVARGHQVTVATSVHPDRKGNFISGVEIVEFDVAGNLALGFRGDLKTYQQFLKEAHFDIIANFAAQQWATDLMLPLLGWIPAKKVFVPTGFSGLYRPEYKSYFEKMKTWMNQYDMNVFLANNYRDINFARQNGVSKEKMVVIPNGASEKEFLSKSSTDIKKKLGIPAEHFLILHVGSHTALKGHLAAIRIFCQANIRQATLLLVGNRFSTIKGCFLLCKLIERGFCLVPGKFKVSKKLIVTELSRAEVVSAFKAANLFLFPSNIECSPLVLFESAAAKTAFLTTDVGNAQEIISWTGGGDLLPTTRGRFGFSHAEIKQSAQKLEYYFNHPDKLVQMGQKGFQAWQKRFTWDKIAKDYERLYQRLLS